MVRHLGKCTHLIYEAEQGITGAESAECPFRRQILVMGRRSCKCAGPLQATLSHTESMGVRLGPSVPKVTCQELCKLPTPTTHIPETGPTEGEPIDAVGP